MSGYPNIPLARRGGGFSLIEVLVALVVLSIGLLGLAGLQAAGLKYNHSAYLRSQATLSAYEILDGMRANRGPALAGAYDIGLNAAAPSGGNIAADDLRRWKLGLAATLPEGKGSIEVENGAATVIVQWDDSRGEDDPVRFVVVTQI